MKNLSVSQVKKILEEVKVENDRRLQMDEPLQETSLATNGLLSTGTRLYQLSRHARQELCAAHTQHWVLVSDYKQMTPHTIIKRANGDTYYNTHTPGTQSLGDIYSTMQTPQGLMRHTEYGDIPLVSLLLLQEGTKGNATYLVNGKWVCSDLTQVIEEEENDAWQNYIDLINQGKIKPVYNVPTESGDYIYTDASKDIVTAYTKGCKIWEFNYFSSVWLQPHLCLISQHKLEHEDEEFSYLHGNDLSEVLIRVCAYSRLETESIWLGKAIPRRILDLLPTPHHRPQFITVGEQTINLHDAMKAYWLWLESDGSDFPAGYPAYVHFDRDGLPLAIGRFD